VLPGESSIGIRKKLVVKGKILVAMEGFIQTVQAKCSAALKYALASEFLLALVVAVVMIGGSIALGYENNKIVPLNPAASAHYTQEPHNPLRYMANWDAPIYMNIAEHGYSDKTLTNFFPLYPLTVSYMHIFIDSVLYSGLLVAWGFFVGAIYFYLKIIKQMYRLTSNNEALRGVLFFVLFPTSIFLMAPYTESLYACTAFAAVYFTLKKNYIPAALFAVAVTATHANGFFVLILMGLLMLEQKEKLTKIAAALAVGSIGTLSYMAYLQAKFHNALEFAAAQKNHSWVNVGPWHLLTVVAARNGIFLLLLIVAALYWWNRRRSFSVYVLLYAGIVFISARGMSGLGRYSLIAFPVQIMLYDYLSNKKVGYSIVLAICSVVWAYFTMQYLGGYSGG